MVKALDESLKISDDFSALLGETQSNGDEIDDAVQNYLNNNPAGLSFSYDKKEYVLAKDQTDGKIKLYQVDKKEGLILKDPEVQFNSQHTPDGMIEIGGLVSAGSRVYITRSAENPSEVIAFAADNTNVVPVDYENAVVIHSGGVNEARPTEPVESNPPNSLPSSGNDNVYGLDGYVDLPDLEDGNYTSKDGVLFDSQGNVLGKLHWLPEGSYKVFDGNLYKEFTYKDDAVFLPMSSYGNFFEIGNYLNEQNSIVGSVTIQMLTDLGVPALSLPITHDYEFSFEDIDGPYSVESYMGSAQVGLIILGSGDERIVIGSTYLSYGNSLLTQTS